MEKHCTARQTSDDNVIRRTRLACWVSKATYTHTQNMQNLMPFHDNDTYANTHQCYVCKYNACLLCWLYVLCRSLSTGRVTSQDSYQIICNGLTHSLSIPNRNTALKMNKYLTVQLETITCEEPYPQMSASVTRQTIDRRDIAVGTVSRLRGTYSRDHGSITSSDKGSLLSSETPRPNMGPIQPRIQWVPRGTHAGK